MVAIVLLCTTLSCSKRFELRVGDDSMAPALQFGDRVVIERWPPDDEIKIERFAIVAFHPEPGKGGAIRFARLVGLPGETIYLYRRGVRIDQRLLEPPPFVPPYGFEASRDGRSDIAFREDFTLEEGQFFLIGDNLAVATDSRMLGAIPRENLVGTVIERVSRSRNRTQRP